MNCIIPAANQPLSFLRELHSKLAVRWLIYNCWSISHQHAFGFVAVCRSSMA